MTIRLVGCLLSYHEGSTGPAGRGARSQAGRVLLCLNAQALTLDLSRLVLRRAPVGGAVLRGGS